MRTKYVGEICRTTEHYGIQKNHIWPYIRYTAHAKLIKFESIKMRHIKQSSVIQSFVMIEMIASVTEKLSIFQEPVNEPTIGGEQQHNKRFHHLSFGHHTFVIIIEIDHLIHVCNFLNTRLTDIKIFDNIESEFT